MGIRGSKKALTSITNCTLWKADRSPACRAVMMALDAMELSITEIDVNMDQCEHKCQEISKMNPLQTLPVFKDREMILYESHAICAYLASRYCFNEACARLYPKDAGGRAQVHQHMSFNCGVLYPRYRNAADPILYRQSNCVMPQQISDIECAYENLEYLLKRQEWFGGSWPTLGDITIGATVSTLDFLVPIDQQRFPRLSAWHYRLSKQSFYTTGNKKGLCEFIQRLNCCNETDENGKFTAPLSSERRRYLAYATK